MNPSEDRAHLIGVIHLLPLPGSPGWGGSMQAVCERAVEDARACVEGGLDTLVVENFGDRPFRATRVDPETIAAMAVAAGAVREAVDCRLGFNVLRNDPAGALGLCAALEGGFVRVNVHCGAMVTDQGIIEGRADETVRLRDRLCPGAEIWADVLVKHAAPLGEVGIGQAARDTLERGRADALIVTGGGTGQATAADDLRAVRDACPSARLYVGSGVTEDRVGATLEIADGAIVGTSLKAGGEVRAPVDPARVRALVTAAGLA